MLPENKTSICAREESNVKNKQLNIYIIVSPRRYQIINSATAKHQPCAV